MKKTNVKFLVLSLVIIMAKRIQIDKIPLSFEYHDVCDIVFKNLLYSDNRWVELFPEQTLYLGFSPNELKNNTEIVRFHTF